MEKSMKIAIVGGAPSSGHLAPFEDQDWEIWAHGNQLDKIEPRRVTRIFEIHSDLTEHSPAYPRWLVDKKIPMVVGPSFPIKENYIEIYPRDEVKKLMDGDHLTSTPAYMMGYALLNYKPKEIAIYGVDMAVDDHEYFMQRPTMYAWIGFAIAKGIKITIPNESPLFKDIYVEGEDSKPDLGIRPFTEKNFKERAGAHAKRVSEIQNQVNQLNADMNAHHAAMQVYEKLSTVGRAVESGQRIDTLSETAVVI